MTRDPLAAYPPRSFQTDQSTPETAMGRGDKKTAKGKRYIASYGNSRSQKTAKKTTARKTTKK